MAQSADVSAAPKPAKLPVGEANDAKLTQNAASNGAVAPGVKSPAPAKRSAPSPSGERTDERAAPLENGRAETQRRRLRLRLFENRARLLEHVSTLILSIVLACIVWFTAIAQENPIRTQTFTVPLETRNVPSGLVVLNMPSMDTLDVVVKAPQLTLNGQTSDDFSAFVDLADAEPGIVERPITVVLPESRIEIVSQQREMLTLQLDPRAERKVPIEGRIMDGPAFGYEALTPIITPISTTIRGPQTRVDEVAEAVVEIYLDESNNQVERPSLPVQLRDAEGNAVEGVQMEPNLATAKVPIEELPGRKEVAVIVNYVGEPARGYRLGSIGSNPATVVLTGDDETLANLPGFVETEVLEIYGASEDVRQRVRLRLPPNVETLETNSVFATVSVTANEGGLKVSRVPVIKNVADGLVASYLLDRVDVILSGPQPLLESLEEDDVRVVLDLEGLLPGSHPVQPDVQVLEGLRVDGVLPETVQVSISEEVTEGDGSTPSQ